MKNLGKLFWIIALTALIGFAMAGCSSATGSDSGGGGGGGGNFSYSGPCDSSAVLTPTLILSGQVYTKDDSGDYTVYKKFQPGSARDITDFDYHGTGTISSTGMLHFTAEVPDIATYPDDYTLLDESHMNANFEFVDFADYYTNLTFSKTGVHAYILTSLMYSGITYINENESISVNDTSASGTNEKLVFMYVGEDITFSGTGQTLMTTLPNGIPVSSTSKNFSLALKQGWNAIYVKDTWTSTLTGSSGTGTESISLATPPLNWVQEF